MLDDDDRGFGSIDPPVSPPRPEPQGLRRTLREVHGRGHRTEANGLHVVSRSLRPGGKENRGVPSRLARSSQGVNKRPTTSKGKRSRAWVFTDNTIRENDTDTPTKLQRTIQKGLQALSDDVRYIIFQRERGVEATADHFQGYVEFYRPYGLSGVKSRVSDTAHWEFRWGTQKQAIDYCRKADTKVGGPWEYGEKAAPGTRTDIIDLRDAVIDGATKRKLIEDYPRGVAKYGRFIDTIKETFFKSVWRHVECILLVGKTRTGKTRWVYDNWGKEDFWVLPPIIDRLWFDGYEDQTHVLIDDFSGECNLATFLRIMDGYTIPLPRKGGYIFWKPTHIAVTSNIHPELWWNWKGKRNSYDALCARFKTVFEFVDDNVDEYEPFEYFTHQ